MNPRLRTLLCTVGLHPWEKVTHMHARGDWDKPGTVRTILYKSKCPNCGKLLGDFNWKHEVDYVVEEWRERPLNALIGWGMIALVVGLSMFVLWHVAWAIFRDLALR